MGIIKCVIRIEAAKQKKLHLVNICMVWEKIIYQNFILNLEEQKMSSLTKAIISSK